MKHDFLASRQVSVRRSNLKLVKAPSLGDQDLHEQKNSIPARFPSIPDQHFGLQSKQRHYFIERITALIEDNIDDEDYRITELCRDAGVSRSQLHRNIKKFTNSSTSEFINSIRLQHAKMMLVRTDLNISQIAYAAGFNDPKYFSRLFKSVFQFSPRVFRKNVNSLIHLRE